MHPVSPRHVGPDVKDADIIDGDSSFPTAPIHDRAQRDREPRPPPRHTACRGSPAPRDRALWSLVFDARRPEWAPRPLSKPEAHPASLRPRELALTAPVGGQHASKPRAGTRCCDRQNGERGTRNARNEERGTQHFFLSLSHGKFAEPLSRTCIHTMRSPSPIPPLPFPRHSRSISA